MKLKATCGGVPDTLIAALDRLKPVAMQRVIGPILKRPKLTASEFFVQKCDFADDETHEPFCEVGLSRVSLTPDRSYSDFQAARAELLEIYREQIKLYVLKGRRIELTVTLMLDGVPAFATSSLVEGDKVIVIGERESL
ncbi:MAG: hypothetical protein HYZ63_01860 [Candidatus Andersenbacteria bacterium]|nr:hypothetical protein [Candidatus Andersenbacteria bacterium]